LGTIGDYHRLGQRLAGARVAHKSPRSINIIAVERKSIHRYFFFGTAFRYLQDAREGAPRGGPKTGGVAENLAVIMRELDELGLPVSARLRHIRDVRKLQASLGEKPEDNRLSKGEARELAKLMGAARPTIDAELRGMTAFVITEKRWRSEKLLESVGDLFRPGTFQQLPEIGRADFEEAAKCIAFERPTAAAFHMLRGTEAVLRECYCAYVRTKRLAAPERMWFNMVKQMRERTRRPPESLLSNLDNIRRSYRNPTQHPDAIYDIHEAQDLFGLCIDTINQMHAAIEARG
jgi:hypothetical protein